MNTRGIRNNNPLNIRKGCNWKGLSSVQSDKSFCQFKSEVFGVRAALCVLRTYRYKYQLKTIRDVISRFAPSSDCNDVERYCYLVRMNMIQLMNHHISLNYISPSNANSLSACVVELQQFKDDYIVNRWINKKVPTFPMFYFLHAMALVESNFYIDDDLFRNALDIL